MREMSISVTLEELEFSVLRDLGNGEVENATRHFDDQFRFKDHGIGLKFKSARTVRAPIAITSQATTCQN